MTITLLQDQPPHLLGMIGTTRHIIVLRVPRIIAEAHLGLVPTGDQLCLILIVFISYGLYTPNP